MRKFIPVAALATTLLGIGFGSLRQSQAQQPGGAAAGAQGPAKNQAEIEANQRKLEAVNRKLSEKKRQLHKLICDQICAHVTINCRSKLPATWLIDRDRYAGDLETPGKLSAALRAILATSGNPRVQLLATDKQIEDYLCRRASGFVGLGLRFEPLQLVNDGLRVTKIEDGSTAAAAGLTVGSLITAVNGTSCKGMRWSEAEALFAGQPDSQIKLSLAPSGKDGQPQTILIKRQPHVDLGLEVELANPTCLFEVSQVLWDSPGKQADIHEHDVITRINGNDVSGAEAGWLMDQATCGHLGTKIALGLERDHKPSSVELERSIVTTWSRALGGMHSQNFDGPGGQGGLTRFQVFNLDWTGLPDWLDSQIADIKAHAGCIIDLRGCSGDDPELAARFAARFMGGGQVLSFANYGTGEPVVETYSATTSGLGEESATNTLWRARSGELINVERVKNPALETKLVVIVDAQTSGTAEALALALQKSGRATVVGSRTAGVSDLVTTTIFSTGKEKLYVQVPALTLLDREGQVLSPVSPDRRVLWGRSAVDTARDELAGRYIYNDPGNIAIAAVVAVLSLVGLVIFWLARRARRQEALEMAGAGQAAESDKPATLMEKGLPIALIVVMLGCFAGLALYKRASEAKPAGATAELVAELQFNPARHQNYEQMFRQLEKEVEGPVSFTVVNDPEVEHYAHPRISVSYRWLDRDGNRLSGGSSGRGAESKLEMFEAIESAESGLGNVYKEPDLKLVTWHRQTPSLRRAEKK